MKESEKSVKNDVNGIKPKMAAEPIRQLSVKDAVKRVQPEVDYECIVCFELLDVDTAKECPECGIGICDDCCQGLKGAARPIGGARFDCPQCRKNSKFDKKLSRHHIAIIQMLEFVCPAEGCGITLQYKDAMKHIPSC